VMKVGQWVTLKSLLLVLNSMDLLTIWRPHSYINLFPSIILCLLSLFYKDSLGQTLPLGFFFGDEIPRTAQLLGDIDSNHSLLIRPINAKELFQSRKGKDSVYALGNLNFAYVKHEFRWQQSKIRLGLLPIAFKTQWNTKLPTSTLDGSMIPSRGLQQLFTGGVYAKAGPITIQLQPEWVWAQNKAFDFLDVYNSQYELRKRYWLVSESPERFGEKAFQYKSFGQSFFRLQTGPVAFRFSNENIFWGPGQFNSLIFSNNAPGFKHVSFESSRPINIGVGFTEFQLIGGILENYGDNSLPFISRRNEERYVNALSLTFMPKWVPGLFLGFERFFQQYWDDRENNFRGWLPVFEGLQKKRFASGFYNDSYDRRAQDQQMAVSVRWLFQESNADIYFQFARGDHAYNWRDLLMSPDHTRAYLAGFKKIFTMGGDNKFFQIRAEVSRSEESPNYLTRYGTNGGYGWGGHIPITQGSTNFGQQLGNLYGPGGNADIIEFSFLNGLNKYGILFDRYEHQMDFYRQMVLNKKDAKPWIDYGVQFQYTKSIGMFIFNSSWKFIGIQNYQWNLLDAVCECSFKSNMSIAVNGIYRF